MLTNDQMASAMSAIRDQVEALCQDHERTAHDGELCWGNRVSCVAYLAHCLGVRGPAWTYSAMLLVEYDVACKNNPCGNHGGDDA